MTYMEYFIDGNLRTARDFWYILDCVGTDKQKMMVLDGYTVNIGGMIFKAIEKELEENDIPSIQ